MEVIYHVSEADSGCADVYFEELFELLGLKAESIVRLSELPSTNGRGVVLFTGEGDYDASAAETIKRFLKSGGTLIALGSKGLDGLLGIKQVGRIKSDSEFSVNGHFAASDCTYLAESAAKRVLPIISDIRNCIVTDAESVEIRGIVKEHSSPVLFERSYGTGKAFYFSFSLLKTLWYKHQGRPVYEDIDGDGYMRSGDSMIPDGTDDFLSPTTDIYLHLLEALIWTAGDFPLIHQIPPTDGTPNDYVLHFSGDEDWAGYEQTKKATEDMAERGIRYHVHLQPYNTERFTIDKAQFEDLKTSTLEPSLHLDFVTYGPLCYDKAGIEKQVELYKSVFGELPVTVNTHYLIYNGFGETSRWLSELGIRGTIWHNSIKTDLFDINRMNLYGFAFGTSYPTHALDDAEHGNVRFNVANLKIGFYEPRIRNEADKQKIDEFLCLSDEFATISNIFIHPIYFNLDREAVLAAVDEILSTAKTKKVKMMSTDEITDWWRNRGESSAEGTAEGLSVSLKAPAVVKFPREKKGEVDGKSYPSVCKTIAGRKVWLMALPAGQYTVSLK